MWITEVSGRTEVGAGALKITLRTEEKISRDELAKMHAEWSGMFRRRFDEWGHYDVKEYEV